MNNIKQLWEQHERRPFPAGCRGKEVQGLSLTMLESEIGGLILSFINTEGVLSSRQSGTLAGYDEKLAGVVDELDGEAKEYFSALQMIFREVINQAQKS